MDEQVSKPYEVLSYVGEAPMGVYYLVGSAEGKTPEQALADNLKGIIKKIRHLFDLPPSDVSDGKIQDSLYVLRHDGLV